jgi:hypothetical protein
MSGCHFLLKNLKRSLLSRLSFMLLEPSLPIQLQRLREMTFTEKWAIARGPLILAVESRDFDFLKPQENRICKKLF